MYKQQLSMLGAVFLICILMFAYGENSVTNATAQTFTLPPSQFSTTTCDSKIPEEQWPEDRYEDISYATPPAGYNSVIAWAVVTIGRVGEQLGKVTVKSLTLWEEVDGKSSPISSKITCPACDPKDQVFGYTLEKALWRDPSAWKKDNEGTEFQINAQGYVVVPAENHPTRVYHFWNTEWPRAAAKQGAKYYVTADALIEGNAIMQIGADYYQEIDGCPDLSRPCSPEAMNSDWYCASSVWQTLNVGTDISYITVISPNGEETWPPGTTQTIRWNYTGNPGAFVKIVLLKGGVSNRTITSSTSIGSGGSGSYNWIIPASQTPGSDYKVKVVSTTNSTYKDVSNNNFTIGRAATYSISGKVATSGGAGISGVTMTLGGAGSGTTTTDSSGNYSFSGLANGSYTVTPGKIGYTFSPTSRSVTITGANVTGQDFTGTPPAASITVTAPNGGENWQRGTTHTIKWQYTGTLGPYVKIVLLKGGVSNRTITSSKSIGSGGSGSYNWTIPASQTPGSDYKIRVVSTSDNTIKDVSNTFFTIY